MTRLTGPIAFFSALREQSLVASDRYAQEAGAGCACWVSFPASLLDGVVVDLEAAECELLAARDAWTEPSDARPSRLPIIGVGAILGAVTGATVTTILLRLVW